jgi:hypothetical protein
MGRVVVLMTACALLAAAGAPAASDSGAVTWRTLATSTAGSLPAGQLLPASSFAGVAPGAAGSLGWRVVVFSSAREVTRALPGFAAPVRAAVGRARAATNFGYRRLVLIAVASRAGCCPIAIAELTSSGATVQLTVRQVACGACPAPGGGIQLLLVSVPRTTFPLPVRLGVGVQPPPTCPAGYSYAGFVSAPAANLTATLTMERLPTLVTPMDHALAYASIVARDAQEVPRAWLQAGIGRGAIGTYADDGRAWIYVEAQTAAGGYQLTEIAPAAAGVPVTVSFAGSGSSWTVDVDGKEAYAADLGLPATGTSTAVEVYRATDGGACPSLDFSLDGVVPKGDQRGTLPLVDETFDGWRVRLG